MILGSTNILTKKSINTKAIIDLVDKDNVTKVKDLAKKELSKGKIPKLDRLLEITASTNMKFFCHLANQHTTVT